MNCTANRPRKKVRTRTVRISIGNDWLNRWEQEREERQESRAADICESPDRLEHRQILTLLDRLEYYVELYVAFHWIAFDLLELGA